jgi:hypothetical protein
MESARWVAKANILAIPLFHKLGGQTTEVFVIEAVRSALLGKSTVARMVLAEESASYRRTPRGS